MKSRLLTCASRMIDCRSRHRHAAPAKQTQKNTFRISCSVTGRIDGEIRLFKFYNGISAAVCEHVALDGLSVELPDDFIDNAVSEQKGPSQSNLNDQELRSISTPDHLSLMSNVAIDGYISRLCRRLLISDLQYSFAKVKVANFGEIFISGHRCPA